MKNPGGRPCKLTDESQQRLCEAIRLGATYKLAAAAAGVSDRSFQAWMARGRAGGTGSARFVAFVRAVKDAEGEGVKTCLAIIRKAALDGQWTAAAWLLERRYPDMYGRVSRVPVESKKEAPEEKPSQIEVINSVREIYGLPPKKDEHAEEAQAGGNGSGGSGASVESVKAGG